MNIGNLIRIRRQALGLKLKDVAKELDISESTMCRYEKSQIKEIGASKLVKLCDVLKISPIELFKATSADIQKGEKKNMKVSEILQSDMCNDNTEIYIDKPAGPANVASRFHGNWYQDWILDYADDVITKLTYIQKDNKIYMEVCND